MFIATEESELESLRSGEIMNDLINGLERISMDEKIIGLYDTEVVERKVRNTQIKEFKLEEIEQGKKEEYLRLAKKFKHLGVSIQDIAKATGLTMDDIEKI